MTITASSPLRTFNPSAEELKWALSRASGGTFIPRSSDGKHLSDFNGHVGLSDDSLAAQKWTNYGADGSGPCLEGLPPISIRTTTFSFTTVPPEMTTTVFPTTTVGGVTTTAPTPTTAAPPASRRPPSTPPPPRPTPPSPPPPSDLARPPLPSE